MLDLLAESLGVQLELDAYQDEYRRRSKKLRHTVSWKLERQQAFRQPSSPSWVAFSTGQWDEALRLLDVNRPRLVEHFADMVARGCEFRRVRVVEQPILPYLHWELCSLRIREELGERVRVIGPEFVREFERERPLPEIVTLGADGIYEINYDDQGILAGGTRFDDENVVASWVDFIRHAYEAGELLADFFDREVAPLASPPGQE